MILKTSTLRTFVSICEQILLTYLSVSMESCNPRADNFAISCAKIEEGGGHKKDPLEPKSNCGEYNFTQLSWKYLNVYL